MTKGMTSCRTAGGSTKEFALRTATNNACAEISSGVTDSIACDWTDADRKVTQPAKACVSRSFSSRFRPSPQDVRRLTILHSNDLHAHLLPDDQGMGGFAYLATAVREERARSTASLYLNAMTLQGRPVSTLTKVS